MYAISPEEFFMYLTIGLVFVIPISVRLYRWIMLGRVKESLRDKGGA